MNKINEGTGIVCDGCEIEGESSPEAVARITLTDLDGIVLDYVYVCDECQKREFSFRKNRVNWD